MIGFDSISFTYWILYVFRLEKRCYAKNVQYCRCASLCVRHVALSVFLSLFKTEVTYAVTSTLFWLRHRFDFFASQLLSLNLCSQVSNRGGN